MRKEVKIDNVINNKLIDSKNEVKKIESLYQNTNSNITNLNNIVKMSIFGGE